MQVILLDRFASYLPTLAKISLKAKPKDRVGEHYRGAWKGVYTHGRLRIWDNYFIDYIFLFPDDKIMCV
jgi:hypothetical protein